MRLDAFLYTNAGGREQNEDSARWNVKEDAGFFRCAKSAVVNIHQIRSLSSCPGGRIEALLSSGEKLIISRRYAPLLRERLKSL